MLQFSPDKTRLWQAAAFSLIYSSLIFLIVRGVILTFLTLTLILLLANDINSLPYFVFALLGVFIMFEAFYRFEITRKKPAAKVANLSQNTNLADLIEIDLARLFLRQSRWETTSDFIKIISSDPQIKFFFGKSGITTNDLAQYTPKDEKISLSNLVQLGCSYAQKEGLAYVDSLNLCSALFALSPNLKRLLFDKELHQSDVENILHWARKTFKTYEKNIPFWEKNPNVFGLGFGAVWMGGWTLETEKYTREFTGQKNLKDSGYLVGREKEIQQIIGVLVRSGKRNMILLGEPGVGKATICYTLAAKSFEGELNPALNYKRFMELDVTAVAASAGEGVVEERLQNILTEVSHAGDVVLFIPEIENLAGALGKNKFDISGFLADTLKNINLQVIGTSTRSSYHQYIETRGAFSNNFEIIDVSEPSTDDAIRILEEVAAVLESRTRVIITYKAIQKAIELSERYIVDKVLPGKAVDLLDEAASAAGLTGKKLLTGEDLEQTISQKTHVPASFASGEEKEKLLKLEEILHKRIVGQDESITAVSQAVKRARTLKLDSHKPNGVFLFLGPTGVGKTETAKALAEVYYGSDEKVIRFDMGAFNQESSVYRLIGSPPGMSEYEQGGQLTEAVRINPFSLVLLDELEKAHSKVLEIFRAIFDEGRTSDSSGRLISFTNTIIIGTSNAGAEFIREEINKNTPHDKLKSLLIEKLLSEGTFRPEFLNRFDDVIVYRPLLTDQVQQVVVMMLQRIVDKIAKQDMSLEINTAVVAYISQKGYDPSFGARPLQRTIQDEIESKVSQAILEGKLSRGSKATIDIVNGLLTIR